MISEESRYLGMTSEKDQELRIITCNKAVAEYTGHKSIDSLVGKTDYDLCWKEYADIYAAHENDGLKGSNYSIFTITKDYTGKDAVFLDTKIGKKDNTGEITTVLCRSVEIIAPDWRQLFLLITQKSIASPNHFFIGKPKLPQFTKREYEILFYLTLGKKTKTIAAILNRSVRTIERHIENAKTKANCRSTNELIIFALSHDFEKHLPQDALKNLIKKINHT